MSQVFFDSVIRGYRRSEFPSVRRESDSTTVSMNLTVCSAARPVYFSGASRCGQLLPCSSGNAGSAVHALAADRSPVPRCFMRVGRRLRMHAHALVNLLVGPPPRRTASIMMSSVAMNGRFSFTRRAIIFGYTTKTARHVRVQLQHRRRSGEERLGQRQAAVRAVVQRALEPLRRRRSSDASCVSAITWRGQRADALGAHRIALVRHRGLEPIWFFSNGSSISRNDCSRPQILREFVRALRDARKRGQHRGCPACADRSDPTRRTYGAHAHLFGDAALRAHRPFRRRRRTAP